MHNLSVSLVVAEALVGFGKSMSNSISDPFAAWQKLVQDWEHQINAFSGKMTESEQFSAMLGQATKMMLVTQKTVSDHLEVVLQSLNLPSKAQIDAINERLDALDNGVEQIRIAIERMAQDEAPSSGAAEPSRTRKPPSRPDAKQS